MNNFSSMKVQLMVAIPTVFCYNVFIQFLFSNIMFVFLQPKSKRTFRLPKKESPHSQKIYKFIYYYDCQ